MKTRSLWILLTIILLLSACQPKPAATPIDLTLTTPTLTPARSTSSSPSPFPSQTPTVIPPRVLPPLAIISLQNASDLKMMSMLGDGRLRQVRISPGGGLIAEAGMTGLRLLDGVSLAERGFLPFAVPINRLDFSPDGTQLLTGDDNGRIRLYLVDDLINLTDTAQPIIDIKPHTFAVTDLRFSPDGKLFISGSRDRTGIIWRIADNLRVRSLGGFALSLTSVSISKDNKFAAAASIDGTTRVWNVRNGELAASLGRSDNRRKEAQNHISSLVFDNVTGNLFVGRADGSLGRWDWTIKYSEPEYATPTGKAIISLQQLTSEKVISLDEGGAAAIWSTKGAGAPQMIQSSDFNEIPISLSISADGQRWATGSYPAVISLRAGLTGSAQKAYTRPGQGGQVLAAAFSPDQKLLVSAHGDGYIRLWDGAYPTEPVSIKIQPGQAVQGISFSADGKLAAAAAGKQVVIFRTIDLLAAFLSGKVTPEIAPLRIIQMDGTAHRLSLSADGAYLATSNLLKPQVQIWDAKTGKLLTEIQSSEKPVEALAFSPAGSDLAVGSTDHSVWLWKDLEPLAPAVPFRIRSENPVLAIYWNSDAEMLAIAGTSWQIRVVHPDNGELVYSLRGAKDQALAAGFSSDGTIIAAADTTGMVRLYDASNGKLALAFQGHAGSVNTIAFSLDGKLLVSASEDGTLRVWAVVDTPK